MKLLISLVFIPFVSLSQVFVHIDTDSILIGDQFQLVFSASESTALPTYNDSIGAIEILSKSHIDSIVQKRQHPIFSKIHPNSLGKWHLLHSYYKHG